MDSVGKLDIDWGSTDVNPSGGGLTDEEAEYTESLGDFPG
jgi:hypothetical protein